MQLRFVIQNWTGDAAADASLEFATLAELRIEADTDFGPVVLTLRVLRALCGEEQVFLPPSAQRNAEEDSSVGTHGAIDLRLSAGTLTPCVNPRVPRALRVRVSVSPVSLRVRTSVSTVISV
ncbi:MAG: hypothetical protein RL885_17905 [Planctomycetota bacterium]